MSKRRGKLAAQEDRRDKGLHEVTNIRAAAGHRRRLN